MAQPVSHSQTHSREFICRLCSYRCSEEKDLKIHAKTHRRAIECLECGHLFDNRRQFNNHYNEYHQIFTCDHCGLSFEMKSTLIKHISRKHTKLECKICDKKFSRYNSLWLHNKVFHGPPIESAYCVVCDLKFTDAYRYKWHLANNVKHKPRKILRRATPVAARQRPLAHGPIHSLLSDRSQTSIQSL
ncbi:PR domain zinc finger protein 5-like [Melitaea cinxia]|uniref:PR domain zinc finger protein 5-like n=1 Tax=Melitaea cinxia TaxID=113334 RepID=UPI001E2708D6|nr:PR domain zinc finger protein 5-like [Melitaea cinxia]